MLCSLSPGIEVHFKSLGNISLRPNNIWPNNVRLNDVWPNNVPLNDVWLNEIWLNDVGLNDVRLNDVEPEIYVALMKKFANLINKFLTSFHQSTGYEAPYGSTTKQAHFASEKQHVS